APRPGAPGARRGRGRRQPALPTAAAPPAPHPPRSPPRRGGGGARRAGSPAGPAARAPSTPARVLTGRRPLPAAPSPRTPARAGGVVALGRAHFGAERGQSSFHGGKREKARGGPFLHDLFIESCGNPYEWRRNSVVRQRSMCLCL